MICPECSKQMEEERPDVWQCPGCSLQLEQMTIFGGGDALEFKVDVEPMGAVRMTGRGKFVKPAAQRYLNYKDLIAFSLLKQLKGKAIEKPIKVNVCFYMPIPKSWSQKKQLEAIGKPHDKKPDIDNLIKGLFDSANKVVWKDDNQVSEVTASKIYNDKPGIVFEVVEL